MHSRCRLDVALSAALHFAALLSAADVSADVVRIRNRALEIGVDRANGRIVEFADRAAQQNFADATGAGAGVWRLEFADPPGAILSPMDARSCAVSQLRDGEPGLRLTWSGFQLPDAPDLRVEVTLRLDRHQALSRWLIAIDAPGERTLARLRFPRLLDLPRLRNECLAMPFWVGLQAEDPRHVLSAGPGKSGRRELDYPGHCSMQCLAFYANRGPGLYLACDDTAGYRKLFAAFSEGRPVTNPDSAPSPHPGSAPAPASAPDLNLEIVHLPERGPSPAGRCELPYATVLGTFRGDWFDAATIYRSWATNQSWARASRWKRGVVPAWVGDAGLWVWNRGRSPNVIDPALALRHEAGLPVAVFWHWWHGCAYDTGFPEYLPPREGDAPFAAALARAHQHDVHALVYMNQRLWGMTTASWTNENAAACAVKAADGQVKPEVYNTFTKLPCATMCLGTEFWRAKYSGLATEAFQRLGVDGIYMDQACSSLACYDPHHGHPLGGGTYWMNGFQKLETDIRKRCATHGRVALAGEGCAENWLPHLDLFLALDVSRERYAAPDGWQPIPFFHAVYHGYGVFYGNYSSLTMPPYDDLWPAEFAPKEPLALLDRKFSRQFCLEQARSFVWGQQPTIANFRPSHLRERAAEIAFVIRLAKLRSLALQHLQDGVMLPPPAVEAPFEEIPMSRLSIYAGQQGAPKEFRKTVPLVLASAWRAADGEVAVAVASIADQPLTPTLMLDTARCGLPKHGQVWSVSPTRTEPMAGFHGKTVTLKPALDPLDARVLLLRSKPR